MPPTDPHTPTTAAVADAPVETRTSRFAGIVSPAAIAAATPLIVGCGAIGSHIARLLAHMGIPRLILVDPDTVSPANLGPQCFRPSEIGKPKVEALHDQLLEINPDCEVDDDQSRFASSHLIPALGQTIKATHVFVCVDSMAARTTIFDAFTDIECPASLLIDCRMGAESAHILTCPWDLGVFDSYRSTLFPDSEAEVLPCGQTSTPHNAACCAALATHIFSLHLRNRPLRPITSIDLNSLSLFGSSHSLLAST